MSQPRIARVFFDVSMANGFDGLKRIARSHKLNPDVMNDGEFVVFINRAQTMIKCLTPGNVMAFYKSPSGRITLDAVKHIPKAFVSDQEFWMQRAITEALETRFSKPVYH